jgi:hypothetical protein
VNAIDLLRSRTAAITGGVAELCGSLDGIDIVEPVVAGTSPIGLTLWHIPRTQDWLVNTSIRGVAEAADRFADGLPDPGRFGIGIGLTPEEARAAAAAVAPARLAEYASDVGAGIDAWLATLDEADLDVVPSLAIRQAARAAYVTPEALEEIDGLDGLTVGVLLARPGLTHLLRHFGELELLVQVAGSSVQR